MKLDRKNLLWEGSRMFLPEHRRALLQQRKNATKLAVPKIDEQQLETMTYILQEAIEYEQPVLATYVTTYEVTCFCGFVDKVNQMEKYIQLSNGSQTEKIPFYLLVDVTWP
ncbi:YolD-like family protein [Shimazuella alba]|uniref:YolD-like family protein n=1 Tax=Shimazuella alba TaxID=2690964 RepID=A0A6I4W0J6_9BACL|nr:YolD-like family protein [Shimazuella alba]MXQ53802.1 YolD-like family protein [Shimazuella alba]